MTSHHGVIFVCALILVCQIQKAAAQVPGFPYVQAFDSVAPPALPPGWVSTQDASGNNYFITTTSVPHSPPNAVLSTNGRIAQALSSPLFDFFGEVPDSISFYTRRTATHLARLILEASLDSGTTFSIQIGDTLVNTMTTNYVFTTFPLPSVLSSSHASRFRWRTIADSTSGATGTIRFDNVLITIEAAVDLELSSMRSLPAFPIDGDSVLGLATVRNIGLQAAGPFTVDWFIDANNDSLPQPAELVATSLFTSALAQGDSVQLSALVGVFPPGERLVISQINYPPDQSPTNNRRNLVLRIGYPPRSIVVNEIMYAPTGTEPECVELFSTRSDTIDLRSWLVSDNIVTTKRIISTQRVLIPPGGYVVLAKDSAALLDIHPGILARVVHMPSLPTLNNTGDAVVLYDNRSVTMDSISYLPSWGGNSGGRSLERVDPLAPSIVQLNWGTSRDLAGSTPGRRNSLTRKDYDLLIDTLIIEPPFPVLNDSLSMTVKVRNVGFNPAVAFFLLLFVDANGDTIGQANELIALIPIAGPMLPLDSLDVIHAFEGLAAGSHIFLARVQFIQDEDTLNNGANAFASIGYPPGTLLLSEIMYAPPAGIPEWVELLNAGADTVDLRGWKVGNRTVSSRYTISASSVKVPPNGFAVISKDTALLRPAYGAIPVVVQTSSLPTFLWSNTGDAVVLADNRSIIMDSFAYTPGWGGNLGTSLERIDPLAPPTDSTNWSSSQDSAGATPGRTNSIILLDYDLKMLRAHAQNVTPQEPATLSLIVQNVGRHYNGGFHIFVYNDANRDSLATLDELITSIAVGQQISPRDSIVLSVSWESPPAGKNFLIARIEYGDDQRTSNNTHTFTLNVGYLRQTLIVNEIMYSPLSENAEYVELYNTSDRSVDLAGWTLSDRPGITGNQNNYSLASITTRIEPGSYFVLASDSSIFALFPSLQQGDPRMIRLAGSSSLSLNNEGDDVVVKDLTGSTIDSVAYLPAWHNPGVTDKAGRALEKIHPLLDGTISRNWSTCASQIGGTPGRQNSIASTSIPSQSQLSFAPNPFSPDDDGHEDHVLIHYEVPIEVSMIRIRIYDVRGRLIRTLVNNEPSGARGDVVWNGRDDDNQKARVGIYVVLLEAISEIGGIVETAKGAVVLAARL